MHIAKLMTVVVIAVSGAAGQEAKEARRAENAGDSSLRLPRQVAIHPDLKKQREQFEQAIRGVENSAAFRKERERFERDLEQIGMRRHSKVLQNDSELQRRLGAAWQQFQDLEASPEVRVAQQQAQQRAKELEASPEVQIRKRLFEEGMKRLEASPEVQEQKQRLQRDLNDFQRVTAP